VCACVVARDPSDPPTLEAVARFMIARGVMRQKIPEQLEVVAALPRNATGKVKKHELRERFAAFLT
jgi:non-ribosomal peptide synthetase component E (peptide arylation enzyme)